jgi:dipeptidyl-peptidase III
MPAAPAGAPAAAPVVAPPAPDRQVLVQRCDDVAIAQLYADGFENLSLDDQRLCWHLGLAAIAGRDIFLQQRCADGVAIRDLLEELITQPAGIDPELMAELERYTTLFWVNNGPHHAITSRKNLLRCTPGQLRAAAAQARASGASATATSDAVLAVAGPWLFDPAFKPMVTAKNPEGGLDVVQASGNSLYGPGVTVADLAAFDEQHELNSSVVKGPDGKLVEQVWRAGSPADGIPPGLYAHEIERIIGHLTDALPYAPAATRTALEKLIRFYRTGAVADREAYDIAWVADNASPVDTVNGFIETYVDARGKKGGFEGIVAYEDPHKAGLIKHLAESAQWFEDRMPYAKEYRKPEVRGISARSIDVVCQTGDAGPVSAIGINLPNDQRIREDYGSKSVSLANVIAANAALNNSAVLDEFCLTAGEVERSRQWGPVTGDLHTNMHEVIGHASGQQDAAHQGDPADWIGEDFSALEEARADLVALYFMADPKLEELGLVDDPEAAARAAYENYTRNGLMLQLRRIREGNQIEEDHMRNRQMVAHWILSNSDAIEAHELGGRQFYSVRDVTAWRDAAGRLLAEVQRIKSTGDRKAAAALFDAHGDTFDPALRDQVVARYARLDVPGYTAFVQPRLSPVRAPDGSLADVTISYPLSLRTQMLEWSGRALPPPEDPAASTVLTK